MGRLKIRRPSDPKTVAILIPRLLLFFLILIPITSLFILIPVAVTGIALLICLFVPIVLCQPISQIPSKGLRFLASVLMIICYPLLCGLLMLTFMMIILLYPCLRNKNHHGVYDPFDNGLSILAVQYLKFTVWLMYCCAEWLFVICCNISKFIKYKDADFSCGSFTFTEYSKIDNGAVNGRSS